jgi:F0F1-type ATP synthase delta subunit
MEGHCIQLAVQKNNQTKAEMENFKKAKIDLAKKLERKEKSKIEF